MTDVHDNKARSYNMSQIRSTNTKPELIVRKYLFKEGFRYRLYDKNLPGKPDIVLPKYKTAIYVHGCFWHGHEGCKYFKIPKTRTEWWKSKIDTNRVKDIINTNKLLTDGWNVIVVYECELKKAKRELTLTNLTEQIRF